MLQEQQLPTFKELVNRLPSLRDIPSLSKDQAKQSLLKARKLLDATVVAVQQLHNWSLRLNFEAQVVVKRSTLNDNLHNRQMDGLTDILLEMFEKNRNPFKALIEHVGKDITWY